MRIIFVRHGEPDYACDCLTETGRRQAAAAAERLAGEGIDGIWTSPMGRAAETAEFTARRLGLPVRTLDFMHEVSWGGVQAEDVPEEGHPWTLADRMITREDFDFYANDWRKHPYFAENAITRDYGRVAAAFDGFLREHGYAHEGTRFRCETEARETVAVFSHGGSGACVLAHLLALPLPYVCTVMPYDYTSVIILNFPVRPGEYVHPRIELFNDTAHIRGGAEGPKFQAKPDEVPGLQEAPKEDPAHTPTVWMIGDSTMAQKDTTGGNPERGWGMYFGEYFDSSVRVVNYARNGRSTKSFIDEGRWNLVKMDLRPGDYVFVEFGHNDAKEASPERYAPAWGAFSDNLRLFIDESRAQGAIPVLLTPVARRKFENGVFVPHTHGDYPAAMKAVAAGTGTFLIDMEAATEAWIAQAGDSASKPYFMWVEPGTVEALPEGRQDDTHSTEIGARRNCCIVCDSLRAGIPALARHIIK